MKRATVSPVLAIDGGTKVHPRPLPMWPQFARGTERRVAEILQSGKVNYWTGSVGREFETKFATWLGTRNAVSVSNGTAALQIALSALGIGSGDEVICTPYSFIASSSCALLAGALPVFCDVGTDHLLDPKRIEPLITRRTKAIVVVHLYGVVADMAPIMAIAKCHGLYVIEDCAQCLGGVYRGRKVGTIGHVGCFSFCQAKHITTGGEGGMVCCNDDELAWEMRALRDHGYDVKAKLSNAKMNLAHPYTHRRVGYNFRMTEIQSAIGLGELKRFDGWNLPRRRRLGQLLIAALGNHPLVKYAPVDSATRQNSFWLVPFVLRTEMLKVPIMQFIQAVQAEGVGAYAIMWPEMYNEDLYTLPRGFGAANYPFGDPRHRRLDYTKVRCEMAHAMGGATIGFWVHPTYSVGDIRAAVKAFKKVASVYSSI